MSALASPLTPVAAKEPFSPEAIAQRATYGLPNDPVILTSLATPGVDVGTAGWGFPMTADEERRLDLNARIRFADQVAKTVLPYVSSLPSFAGAYIDQQTDGSLVVLLTQADDETLAAIQKRVPAGTRSVRVEIGSVRNAAELEIAHLKLRDAWSEVIPDIEVVSAGTDQLANGLHVSVRPDDLERATKQSLVVAAQLDTPIRVDAAAPSTDTTCTDRDHCFDPLRAGIVIRNNTNNSTGTCTMAFHIQIGTDKQFLTAGHCGCAYSAVDWHHMGFGTIGDEAGTMTNLATPKDIMKVQMANSQASALMYADSGDMGDADSPILNETVIASLGISNKKTSGTVTDTSASWTSTYCNKTMFGADSSISTIPGDSGSPLYRRWSYGGEWYITAIGVMNTAVGQFGKVKAALDYWGATIVHP